MTVGEASKILERIKKDYGYDSEKALEMAIKNFDAWEKVMNDIEDIDGNYSPAYWDGVNDVADIITKHLKEVENE